MRDDPPDLLTTARAAALMGVPVHMVKHWRVLGLITDYGGGGKGHASLYAEDEVRSAPTRRRNLRVGWRGRALTNAERLAEKRLASGTHITLPQSSPFRMLAYSCRKCGELVTCVDPRKTSPRKYYPHSCYIETAREASRRPERRAGSARATRAVNADTLEAASRNGYQWTGPELEIVAREDLTARQVAVMLGRTLFAVRTQRSLLRVDPRKQRLAGVS